MSAKGRGEDAKALALRHLADVQGKTKAPKKLEGGLQTGPTRILWLEWACPIRSQLNEFLNSVIRCEQRLVQ
jgi:hypothetical protein